MIDKHIARTLLLEPSIRKWTDYCTHFHDYFVGRWPVFDQLVTFIADFFSQSGIFPSLRGYELELTTAHDQSLLDYVRDIATDASVPIYSDEANFLSALRAAKNRCFQLDLSQPVQEFQAAMTGRPTHLPAIQQNLNTMLARLYTAQQRALGDDVSASVALIGLEAQGVLRADYEAIEAERQKGELSYTLPFLALRDIHIKRGDLLFVGAFTSQGKSLLLRALAYHLATTHGLNVAFWSLETSAKAVRTMISLLHANNKSRFPNTPEVLVPSYMSADLSAEQADFLFTGTNRDLTENPDYGTLVIEQPTKQGHSVLP